jgi:hypothetical protein
MSNEMFTQLPTTTAAQLTDIICAVQNYVSPSSPGTSVQQTLAQVVSLAQANLILNYPGNPNGNLAGTTYQLCWDSVDKIMYVCTTSGNAATAVWTVAGSFTFPLSPSLGGTGANNGSNAMGWEGTVSFIGAYPLQMTLTGATSIIFPTGGILLNSNLTSANMYVGNGSNIATGVAMSGDVSLANTGATRVLSVTDSNGNLELGFVSIPSAVNYLNISNNATGFGPILLAAGSDTNINIGLETKGNGLVFLDSLTSTGNMMNVGTSIGRTILSFNSTTVSRSIAFPDASGTLALSSSIPSLPLSPANGGTGINNGSNTITIGGNISLASSFSAAGSIAFIGAFSSQFTFTGNTSVQFPTTGQLATTAQLPTPAALTEVNDTNVTLTLGGTPTTALLQTVSLTLGWTGTLAPSRGGTGISSLGTGVATALGVNVGTAGAFVVNGGALGTPSSGTLTSCTGLPISTGVSGLGTGVATALAINTGSAGAVVLFNGALGTPSSGTLTSCTGLPIAGLTGLGTGVATALAANVTGSGGIALATSPSFTTPTLGAASATSLNFGASATNGIIGITGATSASAGVVGEVLTATAALNTTSITTATLTDVLTLSITAGQWLVTANIGYFGQSTTTPTLMEGWINTTSATNPGGQYTSYLQSSVTTPFATAPIAFCVPTRVFNVNTTTTVYLSTLTSFAGGTLAGGGQIIATRMR